MKKNLKKIYEKLFSAYESQGWWPLLECKGTNPTKTGAVKGYHPNNYAIPRNALECFEICVGAILTQNTSWVQVEKALANLQKTNALNPKAILKISLAKLGERIKPAGYFNQKAKKLKIFAKFYLSSLQRKQPLQQCSPPSREELLALWGVGPETADSMLLYAFHTPTFVVDAYTKRIFSRFGLCAPDASYDELKALFECNLEKNLQVFQEFHALIVEHAKRHCTKNKPLCTACPLNNQCAKKYIL